MSFDYDSLQARQISFIIYVHGYVRTAASNKHTVALKTHQILASTSLVNFTHYCNIKRLKSINDRSFIKSAFSSSGCWLDYNFIFFLF